MAWGRVGDTKGWAAIAGTELSIPGTENPILASEISRPGFVAAGRSTDRHHRGTRDLGKLPCAVYCQNTR